jgi:hypothetical protein
MIASSGKLHLGARAHIFYRLDGTEAFALRFPAIRGSNAAAGPFSSQPSGLRIFWPAALSLIGQRPQRVFSLFASRIQPKYAAAPLHQSLTWCTSPPQPGGRLFDSNCRAKEEGTQ